MSYPVYYHDTKIIMGRVLVNYGKSKTCGVIGSGTGGLIGTAILPGIGTVIGGLLGGVIGMYTGKTLDNHVYLCEWCGEMFDGLILLTDHVNEKHSDKIGSLKRMIKKDKT